MRKAFLTAAALLVLVPAIANTIFVKSTNRTFSRVKEKDVLLGQQPPAGAIEVGTMYINTKTETAAITDARKWAGKYGANYLVVQSSKDLTGGQQVANKMLHTGQRGKYVIVAYRVESEVRK